MNSKKLNYKMNPYRFKKLITKILVVVFRTLLILGISFIILYPLIESILPAITDYNYLGRPNSIWIPLRFGFLSFEIAIHLLDYWSALVKTFIFSTSMMIVQLFASAIVGYGFAHADFKGSKLLFMFVILTIIVPPQTIMLPQYFHFQNFDIFGIIEFINGSSLNLLGKSGVIYLMSALGMGFRSGLFIFLFRQYYKGLPKELEEAALIDGCGYFRTFFQIILPNTASIMLTVGVFSFVWNYGDTFYTGLFAENSGLLAQFLGQRFSTTIWVSNAFNELTLQPQGAQANPLLLGAAQGAAKVLFILPLLIL
ncbi:MAG: carbohydrate ABC transporter permease, partial [Acholeplasmataceae bacterium]|nr:carbohydrate ABC transporter permease [Acholeplasmataceae bacterium]